MSPLAACTIVAKNYLPFARVLARSFLEHHPGGRFFVLLVDRNDGHIRPEDEPFDLIEVEELDNIPELDHFLFKYTILESSTAVKPYFLEHLFRRYDLENLSYLDPDILVFRPLDELARLLDPASGESVSIVLTPHLTDPLDDDGAFPSELTVLQAGSFNLGFLGLRWTPITEKLLSWWQERLYDRCLVRHAEGLFVDQKWMDLVPGIFRDVHVLTHPGYNVAYWNLHGRQVERSTPGFEVNGEALAFFHFSGFDPHSLEPVSKYQDRFELSDLGAVGELYRLYRDLGLEAGWETCRDWPYAFDVFDDGVRVPVDARQMFHTLSPERRRRFGNPFDSRGIGTFRHWLNEPSEDSHEESPYLSRLLHQIWRVRPDLREHFPDPIGTHFTYYCSWLGNQGRHHLPIDDAFLRDIHRETRATLLTTAGLRRRLVNRWQRFERSDLGIRIKSAIKRVLGHRRSQAVRRHRRRDRPRVPDEAPAITRRPAIPPPDGIERPGINLVGYLSAETGMGEAARSLARALETTDVPVSLHDLALNVRARRGEGRYTDVESTFPYDLNLFVVNADQVGPVFEHLGPEVFARHYNVGFWLWELERFPDVYRGSFDPLHEIWTPSAFCAGAISEKSPLPVRQVPLPVEPEIGERFERPHFGLPDDTFIFFFMFNYLSLAERKNPRAAVEAFRRAFGDDERVLLLLKTAQSDFAPDAHRQLEEACAASNIRLLDEYLGRDEIRSLTALCDVYVSLHRSEGYGLTLAEAMYFGRPVLATPYSGNVDFFNLNNGFPVEYRLVELAEDVGPYPAGSRWAEPSVEHAARKMRRVYEDTALRERVAARGREDVRRELSFEAVGRVLAERFQHVLREVRDRRLWRGPSVT